MDLGQYRGRQIEVFDSVFILAHYGLFTGIWLSHGGLVVRPLSEPRPWYSGAVSIWRCHVTSLGIPIIKIRCSDDHLGPDSIERWHLTSIGNPIVEIRRSYDRLISTMGFPILVRRHLYIESGPWRPSNLYDGESLHLEIPSLYRNRILALWYSTVKPLI